MNTFTKTTLLLFSFLLFNSLGWGVNSNSSDIIADAGFGYTVNIDYTAYQGNPITSTSNSVGVFKFDIRDGGGSNDADALGTELTDITFTIANLSQMSYIRSAALFAGNSMKNNAPTINTGAGTITFSGLSGTDFTAADDGVKSLTLRVSFNTTVTDNEQLQFTITSATANSTGSVFATADAGGATSSTTGDRNRLEVNADRIKFTTQPTDQSIYTNLATFTINAVDINNNVDLDASKTITLTTSGVGMSSSSPYSLTNGVLDISDVSFNTAQVGINITATTTGYTDNDDVSTSFTINDVASGTYRTTSNGTWPSGTATWEKFNGSSWVVATPSANTIDLLIIQHSITSDGAFAANGGVGTKMQIENAGIFNAGHNCTFQSMQINSGGTLNITHPAVDILANTGTVTVEDTGKVIIDSGTLNNRDGFWEGIENFKAGSTIEIKNWDFDAGSGEEALVDTDNEISTNANGYYFGNIVIDVNPDKIFKLIRKTGTHKLCENNLEVTNQTSSPNVTLTIVNANIEIGGNLIINQNTFSFASVGSSNLTHTVKGNIIVNGGTLNLNQNSSAGATVTVNLEGNLNTQVGATLRSTDAGCKIVFKGDGTTQTIDLAGTLGAKADFEVADTAVVQIINQDINLANATNNFDVLSGGTLAFNYFDIKGSGKFSLAPTGILKITSADGVNASGATGNVQNTGTRSFSQTGYYHYVGNLTPQNTGTAMSSGSTAKQILIKKTNDTDVVNLTQSTGTTFELSIIKGVFVETEAANVTGSGDLKMDANSTYKTAVTSNTVPRLSGTYTLLADSEIDLNAAANQKLRGTRSYRDLTFSNSGTKTISSAITNIQGEIIIENNAIVDVENKTMGGVGTDLSMYNNAQYITAGTGTKPDARGLYVLDTDTKIVFANTASSLQSVRLSPQYANIDITGTSVGTDTTGGSIDLNGIFTVKSGATFKHINTAGFNGGTTTAIDNTNSPTITLETDSTIEYAGAAQTLTDFAAGYQNLIVSGTDVKTLFDNSTSGVYSVVSVNQDFTVNDAAILLIEGEKALSVNNAIHNNVAANTVGIEVEPEGSLVQVDDAATNDGTGDYKIHKTTASYSNYDYIFWSSPVSGLTFNDVFAANPNYRYSLDPKDFLDIKAGTSYPQNTGTTGDSYDDNGDEWKHKALAATMESGMGYIIMGAGSPFPFDPGAIGTVQSPQNVTFEAGNVNNGNIAVTVYKDKYHIDGLNGNDTYHTNANLIGNPYPSAIDIKQLYSQNNSVLTGTFYFWTHDTDIANNTGPHAYDFTNDSYATVVTDGNTVNITASSNGTTVSKFIASGQSFLANVVNTIDNTNGATVTFTNTMRVTGNNDAFRTPSTTPIDRIWLNMTKGESVFRQLLVAFNENASDTYTQGQDAQRMENGNNPDFYSIIPNKEGKFAIQSLAQFENTKTVNLGIEITETGIYKIAIDRVEGLFETSQDIYVEDLYINKIHNLTTDGEYVFGSVPGEAINDRFILRFTTENLATDTSSLAANLVVYPNPSNNVFNIGLVNDDPIDMMVYDLSGKVLLHQTNTTHRQIDLSGYSAGFYFAKISQNGQQTVKKLILK